MRSNEGRFIFAVIWVLSGCGGGESPPRGEGGGGVETCATIQCDVNATCAETPDGAECLCKPGFTGDGKTCTDLDECADGTADCDEHATCSNIEGSFTCSCDDGWVGTDGKSCTDYDECMYGAFTCDANASCVNTDGAYGCACNPGYSGDGKTCTDVDACATAGSCDANAECANSAGSFSCACKPGFTGDGKTCTDVDECATAGSCDANAECTNAPGSFSCACKPGFTGDGKTCTDIDECADGTAGCDAKAACANTPGAFTCTCGAGYEGDGKTCARPRGQVAIGGKLVGGELTTTTPEVTLYLQEPGNLVKNPGAETGDLSGWTLIASGGSGWNTGLGDPRVPLFGDHLFLTSYQQCKRSQQLDLLALGYTAEQLDAAPDLVVREWYHGVGYDASVADTYYFKVELRDAAGTVIASFNPSATTITTDGTWRQTGQTFSGYGPGVRFVYLEDGGDDKENWAGYYGPAMDQASVVVGSGYQVRVSNDGVTFSDWQPYAPTLPWTLEATPGDKLVYVQFMDADGNLADPVSAAITLQ